MIKLYKKNRLNQDLIIYGGYCIYKIWIFEFRLNPEKMTRGLDTTKSYNKRVYGKSILQKKAINNMLH